MTGIVVDASIALAWFLRDEEDGRADVALERLEDDVAVVPGIWALEVANALVVAERRGRISEAETGRILSLLDGLPVDEDPAPREVTQRAVVELARRHGLSAYDAAYLELAVRRGAALATLDGRLHEAAASSGVETL